MLEQQQLAVIRDRNDAVRKLGLNLLATRGIRALADLDEVLYKVRSYDAFDSESDPYGEHDFGSFFHKGQKILWKIDYYVPTLKYWSDPVARDTRRVLTVMLAEEY